MQRPPFSDWLSFSIRRIRLKKKAFFPGEQERKLHSQLARRSHFLWRRVVPPLPDRLFAAESRVADKAVHIEFATADVALRKLLSVQSLPGWAR
uniref:Uncharacterized protein n=1 Tax=Paenibacillus athensensis TaxID=1967502 RepID=A0A4Y8QAN3_9BACL